MVESAHARAHLKSPFLKTLTSWSWPVTSSTPPRLDSLWVFRISSATYPLEAEIFLPLGLELVFKNHTNVMFFR